MPNWRHPMAQNPFSSSLRAPPSSQNGFLCSSRRVGERCSSLGVLTHTSSVCFCHVSPGITFSTLDARSRGWVGWDTLCHTLLTIRGDAVWQKRATLGRRSVEKTTLRQNTLFLSARPLSLLWMKAGGSSSLSLIVLLKEEQVIFFRITITKIHKKTDS